MRVYLVFCETATLSSRLAVPFCIPTSNEWEFLLLHILARTCCCQCLDFGHSKIYVAVLCVWICSSLMTYDVGLLFICLFATCIASFFGEVSVQVFCLLLIQIVFQCLGASAQVSRCVFYVCLQSLCHLRFGANWLPSDLSFHGFKKSLEIAACQAYLVVRVEERPLL